ncbi:MULTISPECIES: DUF1643 domain-containing protein [Acetobacter]|uniref:DUF1643 domain-containing protein n=1 Tax=Acetobacter persici TaxID=1076596 RepID=A0A6V8I6P1_9PROT|nr:MULTISPECIES: DUF1643 domain-containing protein [Acetobacter]MBS1001643.1 DUF1643 domain-containing protein [Acetobacter persici]MBS1016281.1 DUF1643 domain-containing protein [Acetobacter persici]MCG0997024.1 DUF1643 domain-containing protein [Acetobacter persici]OUI90593.1 hypothetical protein HK19_09320 [Acetobacter persici]GFE93239.1 hypothetical protein DmAi_12980 [Acetobacter persici]
MQDLFNAHHVGNSRPLGLSDDVVSTATYGGPDQCYRYSLKRVWDASRPVVMWLMMNPSVATEVGDDRTVAKCQRYARAWGYGGILVGNTFAYRCTDQTRLLETPDPVGPENDAALLRMAQEADLVIAAYGSPQHKALRERGPAVVRTLQQHGIAVYAMKVGVNGRPCHPLYLPAALRPVLLPAS